LRLHERIDGSLTTWNARKNRLEAVVVRGMVEDGLRAEMSAEEHETARSPHDAHLQHFQLRRSMTASAAGSSSASPNSTLKRSVQWIDGRKDDHLFNIARISWIRFSPRAGRTRSGPQR
jgi:hypothetical protein